MLGGDRAKLARENGATDRLDLVGVDLGDQATAPRTGQDHAALLGGKHALFAEYVAEAGEAVLRGGGDHFLAQKPQIARAVVPVFRRDGVRAHKGRHQLDWLERLEPPDRAQLLQLLFGGEAVAALDLAGRRAPAEHRFQLWQRLLHERRFTRGAGGLNGGQNAAAARQNFKVAHAVQLKPQLVLTPAAEDQMRVRVHKARRDQAALCVKHLRRAAVGRRAGAGGGDHAVLGKEPCVFGHGDLTLRRAAPGLVTGGRGKQADVLDQQAFHSGAPLLSDGGGSLCDDGVVGEIGQGDVAAARVFEIVFGGGGERVFIARPCAA